MLPFGGTVGPPRMRSSDPTFSGAPESTVMIHTGSLRHERIDSLLDENGLESRIDLDLRSADVERRSGLPVTLPTPPGLRRRSGLPASFFPHPGITVGGTERETVSPGFSSPQPATDHSMCSPMLMTGGYEDDFLSFVACPKVEAEECTLRLLGI